MESEAEDVADDREDLSRDGLPTLLPEDLEVDKLLPEDLIEVDGLLPLLLGPADDRLLVGENRPPLVVLKRSLMERLAEEAVEEEREGRRIDGCPILLPSCLDLDSGT